jgi:hypothetical protein
MDGLKENTGAGSDGELGYGNASDVLSFKFLPILKGAVLLENTQGVDKQATQLGKIFNNNCENTKVATVNSGVSIKSIKDETARLSYVPIKGKSVNFNTDIPYSIYVGKESKVSLAQIKYQRNYANKTFYVELEGIVYEGTFPATDLANKSSNTPLDIGGNIIRNQSLLFE